MTLPLRGAGPVCRSALPQTGSAMTPIASDRLRHVTSRQNPLVKELRRALERAEATPDGHVAVESPRLLEEAIRSGLRFKAVFFRESALPRMQKLLPQISSQAETLVLPDPVFDSAVTTETPQGVAALVRWRPRKFEDVPLEGNPLLLVAAGVQDPGNLGTMIRSAEAFAAAALLLGPGTVSPLNSKVIRASAGSLFRLPVAPIEYPAALEELRRRGIKLLATSSHKGKNLAEADLAGSVAVFIGNEGAGLPRELSAEVTDSIVIPHSARVESLNAGIAASIVLYEAARQRSIHHGGTEDTEQMLKSQ